MLAGMGVPGDEALILQLEVKLPAMGMGKTEIDKQRALNEKIYAIVKTEDDPAEAKKKILDVYEQEAAKLPLLLRVSNAVTGSPPSAALRSCRPARKWRP